MGKLGTSKLDVEKIKELHLQGKNDKEIAVLLSASPSTVCYVRKSILKLKPVIETIDLTKEQEEILIGTLLGDSYIGYTHSKCRFPNLTFCHCKKQALYANTKFNKLKIIMSSMKERQYKSETIIQGKMCKIQPVIYAIGHNCKCLVKYRELFYNLEGKKIIPIDFLKDHFTAQSLAYLFMDDGCKNQKSYNLNLQCFTEKELIDFAYFLKTKFNLDFIIKKDKTMYLRYKSIQIFESLIKPYITEDMQYKIH